MGRGAAAIAVLIVTATASAAAAKPATAVHWVRWDGRDDRPKVFRLGPFVLTGEIAKEGVTSTAWLTVASRTAPSHRVEGETAGPVSTSGEVAVVKLDRRQARPVILFRSFTGGAHCCLSYRLIEERGHAWRVVDLGDWDDSAAPDIVDVDQDGRMEFVGRDQRFQYAFTSYAESVPPPRIYAFEAGKLTDVSDAPAFRRLFRAEYEDSRNHCRQERARGYCASYAATAARLGEMKQAGQDLDLAFPQTPGDPDSAPLPNPPRGGPFRKQFPSFRAAVTWYLESLGYLPANRSNDGG